MFKLFEKMSVWLDEHTRFWNWGEKDGALHLITLILTPILMFTFFFVFSDVTLPLQLLFAIVTFVPAIVTFIYSLITKTKWNPLWCFSMISGATIGGIIACIIFYLIYYI